MHVRDLGRAGARQEFALLLFLAGQGLHGGAGLLAGRERMAPKPAFLDRGTRGQERCVGSLRGLRAKVRARPVTVRGFTGRAARRRPRRAGWAARA